MSDPAGAADAEPFIVVAVPTYKRPEMLRSLLEALAGQEGAPPFMALVADNDGVGQEGMALVRSSAIAALPLRVEAMLVEAKGLCNVRNAQIARALDMPGVTHLAMLDDDECPPADWLTLLMAGQVASGAELVAGPVDYVFEGDRPGWADQTLIFRQDDRPAGPVTLWGSANVLISADTLRTMPRPWFDLRFNFSGGEDLDFFHRIRAMGARAHWVPEARVKEWVPADRASLGWAMRRMWRIGQTDMLVARKHADAARRMLLPVRAAALLAFRSVLLPMALVPGRRRYDYSGEWVKALGRLSTYVSKAAQNYS